MEGIKMNEGITIIWYDAKQIKHEFSVGIPVGMGLEVFIELKALLKQYIPAK
jgi:hypothetical protein